MCDSVDRQITIFPWTSRIWIESGKQQSLGKQKSPDSLTKYINENQELKLIHATPADLCEIKTFSGKNR